MSANPPIVIEGFDNGKQSFICKGKSFIRIECTDWFGFYDWLRNDEGKILGLRLFLDGPEFLDKWVPNSDYVSIEIIDSRFRKLSIFFDTNKSFSEIGSDDQLFGGNVVYLSDSRDIAINFLR
jgi:hypothetical protein